MSVIDLAHALPKAELHLHIEGSLEPDMMQDLARRNNVTLPYDSLDDIRAAYDFSNLQDFLDIYYAGMAVLQTEADFYDLTYAYLKRAQADNVRHAEIMFDPQAHLERGIAFETVLNGITGALHQGEGDFGITSKLIMCILRHLPEKDALALLDIAEPYIDRIYAVGLDSSELGHPPSKFERAFARARGLGLKVVAHAGEEGPPEFITEALDVLKVDRIDHGNAAKDDAGVAKRLADLGMTLTMCPLSNLKLCVLNDLKDHPLKSLMQRGVPVTVNSDDPAYFGGYVNENYTAIIKALDLTRDDIVQLAKLSFSGSFLDEGQIALHHQAIDAALA